MINPLPKPQKIRSKKIRNSAKGENCTLRIPGVCNGNPETTVFAHINTRFKGMGNKSPDLFGVYACSSCHDWLDNRLRMGDMLLDVNRYKTILHALVETLDRLYQKNLININ